VYVFVLLTNAKVAKIKIQLGKQLFVCFVFSFMVGTKYIEEV